MTLNEARIRIATFVGGLAGAFRIYFWHAAAFLIGMLAEFCSRKAHESVYGKPAASAKGEEGRG